MELAKLIIAHLAGDFFLQSKKQVEQKQKLKWRSPFLYLHAVVHFLLILLIFFDLSVWLPALIIAGSHLIIDGLKLTLQKEESEPIWFGIDQLVHLLVIGLVYIYFFDGGPIPDTAGELWIVLAGALFLTKPASIIMQKVMGQWSDEIDTDQNGSLKGAGEYIGILERLFAYIAILAGVMQVVGFLIAAKSVFRFGDLTRAKDRKLTEYILIGTLLSFLIAILTGLIAIQVVG